MAESLDYAARLAMAKKKRSLRWLWITLASVAFACFVIWLYFWSRPYFAAHKIAVARTSADEKMAFEYAHEGSASYSVQFYDATGREIYPHLTGVYGPVTSIRVRWDNGASVTAPLRDTSNLGILLLPD